MNTSKLTVVAAFVFLLLPLWGRSQKVEIYIDERNNQYAAINLTEMPRNVEDRNNNVNFYAEVQLLNTDGTVDLNEYVKRIVRHQTSTSEINDPDKSLSWRFILSPDIINSDGTTTTTSKTMTWAEANGYQNTANSQIFNREPPVASAATTGCSAYRGKDGNDEQGTWRVPTHREGAIIMAFQKELEATEGETDFVPFVIKNNPTQYWLATEFYGNSEAWYMNFAFVVTDNSLDRKSKNTKYYLRCIRDIAVE